MAILRMDTFGLSLLAPVCRVHMHSRVRAFVSGAHIFQPPLGSSWVWISRFTTRRTFNRPLGDPAFKSVRLGNKITARTCWVLVALCVLVRWLTYKQDHAATRATDVQGMQVDPRATARLLHVHAPQISEAGHQVQGGGAYGNTCAMCILRTHIGVQSRHLHGHVQRGDV